MTGKSKIKSIDDELLMGLEELVLAHKIATKKSLNELKDTIEYFYERFLEDLE